MARIWLTTDTHFGHKRMIDFSRPKDFEERIRRQLATSVKPGETLIHLGDVSLVDDERHNNWFKYVLNCRTVLVRGNHDERGFSWYLGNGWDFVCDRLDLKLFGAHLALTHAPIPPGDDYDLNIHGHLHDSEHHAEEFTLHEKSALLALEETGYAPVLLKTFVEGKLG